MSPQMTPYYKMKKVFCLLFLVPSISAMRKKGKEENISIPFRHHDGGERRLNDYQRKIINKVKNVKSVDNNNLML
jgi:hypothetical protein